MTAPGRPLRSRGRGLTATALGFTVAIAMLVLANPQTTRGADPAPASGTAAAPALTAVAPAEFAAGGTITITGSNFAEGDTLLLDSLTLTDLKITPTRITATVPDKAKAGKKLVLKRGKKKAAELTAFTFVPAPRLTSVTPKFAAPGETVTIKGKGLAKVTELTLAGSKVKIAEQTDTAIKFVAVEGSKTGPLAVKSPGGEAAVKKDYEVFYAPTLASAEPTSAFEGDSITVKGAHLAAPVKFKLGSKALKFSEQADTEAALTIAKGSKTGPLKASARGKSASLAADFTVHPTPVLTTVPKEVGAPGELKVSGKHLDAVTTWRLGQVTLTPVAAATAGKVVLTIPADAPVDQPLIAVTQGREFASKKPVVTVKTPVVHGLAFWTGAGGKGVEGVVRGADFSEKTKFTLGGKPLKTHFVAADRVGFNLPKAPPTSVQKLTARAGKYTGAPVEVDGAGQGYRVAADKLAALLPTGLTSYDLTAAQLDLEVSEHLAGEAEGAAQQSPDAARVAALGLRLAQDLQRVSLAQAAVCTTMVTGKDKAPVAKNAPAGEVLRQSTRHAQTLLGALTKLWSTLGPDALATAGLAEVDAAIASVGAAQPKVQAACKGRYHGSGTLATEAATTVKLDLDKLYRAPILGAFEDVLSKGRSWSTVEKEVGDRLSTLPAARRKVWQDILKSSKTAVEASATKTTGKGATGDKHVEKQGKPKGGKGKAK